MKKVFLLTALFVFSLAGGIQAKSLSPMKPLMFKGKPFMPIGVYDARYAHYNRAVCPEFIEAGCNIMVVGPGRTKYRKKMDFVKKAAKQYPNLAIIIDITFLTYKVVDRKTKTFASLRGAELEANKQTLRKIIKECKEAGNVIGYYYDEPENMYHKIFKGFKKAGKTKDSKLAKFILKELTWIREIVKKEHPEAYLMPVIAWWSTYRNLGPLYDVLIANQYPMPDKLFEIVYDARRAIAAVRANKKLSLLYMPPSFNIIHGKWKKIKYTVPQQRYAMLAPIAAGSMGTLSWRLRRCSKGYANKMIFPAIREIKELEPWLLGEWHDEKVSSNHDGANAGYLKKAPIRVMLLDNENENATEKTIVAIPDVVYALRYRPDTKEWLLLAACNRREKINVNFSFKGLPGKVNRVFEHSNGSNEEIKVIDGIFKDKLDSFSIKRYHFITE